MTTDMRSAILDVAQELLQSRGPDGMSYQDISNAVKIRKASIHYHFPTKDKLIEAVLRRYTATFLESVDAIIASKASAPVKLRRYIELFDRVLRTGNGRRVCLCGMLGAEFGSLSRPAAAQLQRFFRENTDRLARIVADGRSAGTLSFEGDAKQVAMLMFSFLEGAMLMVRAGGGLKQFRGLTEQMLALVKA